MTTRALAAEVRLLELALLGGYALRPVHHTDEDRSWECWHVVRRSERGPRRRHGRGRFAERQVDPACYRDPLQALRALRLRVAAECKAQT